MTAAGGTTARDQPPGTQLAQLNIGRLLADPDDARVAGFMDNVDRINAIGKCSPGFVWMMEGSGGPGNTDAKIGGDPRFISNLTVWESVAALERFVWTTVHRSFYARRTAWFEALEGMHFVMWWVPEGHRPGLDEALDRLAHREAHGDDPHAFGWDYLHDAPLWRDASCRPVAAPA